MLKIKLARFGKTHQPHFRIVVNEARDKRDGRYVANIGHYIPNQQPKVLVIDMEAYDAWMKKGAQPTETVKALAERFKSGKPFEVKAKVSKKAKAKQAAAQEAPVEEATAPATEEPAVVETAPVEEAAPVAEASAPAAE